MKLLPFTKLSGAGNDFILVEDSSLPVTQKSALAKNLCRRQRGIGADGILIVHRNGHGSHPSVDYYNADGSRAFCGNGTRCAAWWMHLRHWTGRRFSLNTVRGRVNAQIAGTERVRLTFPLPKDFRCNLRLAAVGRTWTAHFVEVGVPHAVVEVGDIENVNVAEIGRTLRYHKTFKPQGANIDFMAKPRSWKGHEVLKIRTYERGVEGETLACGSGVVASAFCAHFLHGAPSPIRVATRGGDVMTVDFKSVQGRIAEAWLEGPARITFEGKVTL